MKNGEKCWSSRWYKISLWSTEIQIHLGQWRSNHRRCSINVGVLKNFAIFTGKTLELESLYNKVTGLQACDYIDTSVFLWTLLNFKNTYFEYHLRMAACDKAYKQHLFFSFSKNVFYSNQIFLRLDFSLFSLRVLIMYLKRLFLIFSFSTAILYYLYLSRY